MAVLRASGWVQLGDRNTADLAFCTSKLDWVYFETKHFQKQSCYVLPSFAATTSQIHLTPFSSFRVDQFCISRSLADSCLHNILMSPSPKQDKKNTAVLAAKSDVRISSNNTYFNNKGATPPAAGPRGLAVGIGPAETIKNQTDQVHLRSTLQSCKCSACICFRGS